MLFSPEQLEVAKTILDIAQEYRDSTGVPPLVHLAITHRFTSWTDIEYREGQQLIGPYRIPEWYEAKGYEEQLAWSTAYYGFHHIEPRWRKGWFNCGRSWAESGEAVRLDILVKFASYVSGRDDWDDSTASGQYSIAKVALIQLS